MFIYPVPAPLAATRSGERHLPVRLRQAVCAFHVTVIAELQNRVIAAVGGHDKFAQVRAPAQGWMSERGLEGLDAGGRLEGLDAGGGLEGLDVGEGDV